MLLEPVLLIEGLETLGRVVAAGGVAIERLTPLAVLPLPVVLLRALKPLAVL